MRRIIELTVDNWPVSRAGHRLLLGCVGATILVVVGRLGIAAAPLVSGCDVSEAVRVVRESPALVLRDGRPLGGARRWVPLAQLPAHVPLAFVAVEDRRIFAWYHRGVDPIGVATAAFHNATSGSRRGASTIAMQVVQALCHDHLPSERTWPGKVAEAVLAHSLTSRFGDSVIVELYLNTVYLGGGAHGIEEAAWQYFGRRSEKLTASDAAELAHLVASPGRRDPRRASAASRRAVVERVFSKMASIESDPPPRKVALGTLARQRASAPSLAWCARSEAHGCVGADCPSRVLLWADSALQHRAQREVDLLVRRLERGRGLAKGRIEGVFASMDTRTGQVRALVGRRSDNPGGLDILTRGRIRPASALKPLLLAAALDAGLVKLSMSLGDLFRSACPGRETHAYLRKLSGYRDQDDRIEEALWRSDNVLAPCLLAALGAEERQSLVDAGLLPSLAAEPVDGMGIHGASPLNILSAYASLANGGLSVAPRCSSEAEPVRPTQLFSRSSADLVHGVLRGVVTRGTARAALRLLGDDPSVAGKTGTAEDNRELLFVGFRGTQVALLWVGVVDGSGAVAPGTAGQVIVEPWARVMRPTRSAFLK